MYYAPVLGEKSARSLGMSVASTYYNIPIAIFSLRLDRRQWPEIVPAAGSFGGSDSSAITRLLDNRNAATAIFNCAAVRPVSARRENNTSPRSNRIPV